MSHTIRFPFLRSVSLVLIFGILNLSSLQVQAGMLSTSQAISHLNASSQRERVLSFLDRQEVQEQLVKWGVNAQEAHARVQSLSDSDLQSIGGKLDQLPAGQDAGSSIVGAVVLIFIILLITDLLHLTKVFPFTR